ncbi:MAG: acyl-CoA thioesterase [Planctomycetota bacterium]|nr:acyl-CoA thioesterase [Planctomycetota bacterium]
MLKTTAHISRLVLPGLINRHGSLFGGVALSLMDEAAGIVSTRVARGPCVTAHIQSVDFEEPIWEGEVIAVEAKLIGVGRTSMRIRVETWGERLEDGTRRRSTAAEFVMVAIDKDGRPRPVPDEARRALEAPEPPGT